MGEGSVSDEKKRAVAERACGCCEYCHSQVIFSPDPFSVEHVLPRARGGSSSLDNLAFSCQGCNNRKYTSTDAIDPASGALAPIYHPRQHVWSDHFVWNEGFSLLIGLTPTGRATIAKLELNRPGLVNLRRVLHEVGEHPPALPHRET
jgi:hypothetical protein